MDQAVGSTCTSSVERFCPLDRTTVRAQHGPTVDASRRALPMRTRTHKTGLCEGAVSDRGNPAPSPLASRKSLDCHGMDQAVGSTCASSVERFWPLDRTPFCAQHGPTVNASRRALPMRYTKMTLQYHRHIAFLCCSRRLLQALSV